MVEESASAAIAVVARMHVCVVFLIMRNNRFPWLRLRNYRPTEPSSR
jgi:hypothetical protein